MSEQSENQQAQQERFTVRTLSTGDKVYLIENGQRMWIRNPETLNKLGFSMGEEKTISYEDLMKYKDGGSIDLQFKTVIETKPEEGQQEEGKEDEDASIAAVIGYRNTV